MCRIKISIKEGWSWLAGLVVWSAVHNHMCSDNSISNLILLLTGKLLNFNCNISMISFMDLRNFNLGEIFIIISIHVIYLERGIPYHRTFLCSQFILLYARLKKNAAFTGHISSHSSHLPVSLLIEPPDL